MSEIEFRIAEILGRSAIENDMEVPKDVQQLAQATRYLATQLRIICEIEIGDEKMAEDNGMGGGRRGGAGYRGGIRRRVCRAAGDRRPGIRLARGGARQPGGVAARDFADGAFGTSECVFLQPGRCGRGTVSCRQSGVLGHQRRQRPQGLQRAAGHEGGARRAGRAGGGDIPRLCRVPDVRFGRPHGKDIRAGELHGNLAGVP